MTRRLSRRTSQAVTATAATSSSGNLLAVRVTAEQLPHRVRVMEIKDGDARMRLVAPDYTPVRLQP